ncbi:DNA mismatch repair protein MutS [Candidatus Woesearchaeota archaeon]|nr:DNA mismatch repair protein MutS [Candidatus Woesearchaeota archaeon]
MDFNNVKLTPAMKQYAEAKKQYPDCVLLFRMGDFYETFYEDAKLVARELEITLTARGKGETRAPLAGLPYHALEPYLAKLVKKGYKVAICEQLEDPKLAKGVVKRGVVRIVTPGTVVESNMLDSKSNNYLMSVSASLDRFGIALVDISTAEFLVAEVDSEDKLINEVTRFNPAEIIIPVSLKVNTELVKNLRSYTTSYSDTHFSEKNAFSTLTEHFKTSSLHGFGIQDDKLAISAAGALLSYLKETQKTNLDYINKVRRFQSESFMLLDSSTQRNLELIRNIRDNSSKATLLSVLDRTVTPLGSRLMKKWLLRPLTDITQINKRLDAVEELAKKTLERTELRDLLKQVYDIERLISRVNYGNANPRDLIALKRSLQTLPSLKNHLNLFSSELLKMIADIPDLLDVAGLIQSSIKEEPALLVREGNIIKKGYNAKLDEIREIAYSGKEWITKLEAQEKSRTGISSLRVGFNKVFGYYITVSKANLHLVPKDYMRKQTLVGAERFITPELKEKESLILGAEEKINNLEYELFQEILKKISEKTELIQDAALKISNLDVLISLANVAVSNNYVKPIVEDSRIIELRDSRHPVVETIEDSFVPNDCFLDNRNTLHIITGPNMAGKSTFMRQIALIQLMAQLGSFVPCTSARLGVVDRIFTRVGAYDDLTMGQSTFMVEMTETANILNNATSRSLIILDEIGRGTSTFDGISLAWSIAEYIHDNLKAKTLFATHYHQLNKLAEKYKSVRNYNIAVKEDKDDIIFLRKIIEGGTDKSYGIQVARLAGLPIEVVERSKIIMNRLEMEDEIAERVHKEFPRKQKKEESFERKDQREHKQLSLFDL